ncbi:MAG TPA: ABC transporter ATP-binding protein [Ruminiclostridium sp.]|nr:ABC transporter ATP-binding protein [Ruminiclostridium sp.]
MIELRQITAGYSGKAVIHDISLAFERGTITGIIGKNGCGKTTLLKTAANLLRPQAGSVLINGESVLGMPGKKIAAALSYLPQIREVPNMTVYNLVMHGRFPYLGFPRIPLEADRKIAKQAMELAGILACRDKNIRELSGGERQKAYIAMLLAQDTDAVFLDEPTTYLDINHQLEILELIRQLKKMGKTLVMVVHDLSSALCYSDRICLMEKGRIAVCDTPDAVFKSGEIERIFHVACEQVPVKDSRGKRYVFSLDHAGS